ncbi:MAG: DUF1109 domain-containing protein [Rhizomicrobium sp.]
MKTDALIESLTERAGPVTAATMTRAMLLGLGGGVLASFVLMQLWLGIRPDLMPAMHTGSYWMKFFYTLMFAVAGFWTLERLSRPGASSRLQMVLEALPFALLAAWASMKMMMAPVDARMTMLMGSSHQVCPWRIVVLAFPVFAGVFWGLRKAAPTRPVLTGAMAGLLAGAAGAFIYALHCDESAAAFVAMWYTLGIAMMGLFGAVLGRFALRW